MGSFSIWHWLVVLLVILLLFGSGKISGLMGDLAKGIKSFKQNMKEDEAPKGCLDGGRRRGADPGAARRQPGRPERRAVHPGAAGQPEPPRGLTEA